MQAQLPVHFIPEAAGGESLRVSAVADFLAGLGAILKLLNDVPHAARPDCQYKRYSLL